MIKHIVMWKLKDFADGRTKEENIDLLIEKYEELKKEIPQIADAKIMKNITDKEGMFDTVLFTSFDNKEQMEEYLNHPSHKEYAKFCKELREDRASVDFEV
ncbi:MAG: Dabb family protein [Clostridia bacterium]|nr:Dabb family protein [Clostridia bacterium]